MTGLRPDAEAKPSLPKLLALLLPAAFALYATFNGVQQISIPLQVEGIDPSRKVERLGLIITLCSVASVLGLVSGGVISDATRSRVGRRTPWLAGMALASALMLLAMGRQTSITAIVALSGALWFALNFFQASLLAVTPDRVPASKRAMASWIFGFSGPVGALLGVNICAFASLEGAYATIALFLALATAAFVVFAPEGPYETEETGSIRPNEWSFWSATTRLVEGFASRDFALAFVARSLLFLAQYTASAYLLYALQDYVGPASLPGHSAQTAAGLVNTIRTAGSIAMVVVTGWLLQRTSRRKAFLQVYAGLTAAALIAPALSATWTAMLIFAGLSGAAYGIFASVDLAIITQVLPARESAGRDIGLLAVTGAAPQLVAPAIAGLLIHNLGYGPLFAFAALATLAVGGVSMLIGSLD